MKIHNKLLSKITIIYKGILSFILLRYGGTYTQRTKKQERLWIQRKKNEFENFVTVDVSVANEVFVCVKNGLLDARVRCIMYDVRCIILRGFDRKAYSG